MEEKEIKRKRKIILLCIVILLICLIIVGIYLYNKQGKMTNNQIKDEEEETVKKEQEEINPNAPEEIQIDLPKENQPISSFDFEELETSIKEKMNSENMKPSIVKCIDKGTAENGPDTENAIINVSDATIDSIINKLKMAETVDLNITYSFFGCPPKSISYYIGDKDNYTNNKVLTLYYANDENVLLLGYNESGYAFHYKENSEIEGFIESLS